MTDENRALAVLQSDAERLEEAIAHEGEVIEHLRGETDQSEGVILRARLALREVSEAIFVLTEGA